MLIHDKYPSAFAKFLTVVYIIKFLTWFLHNICLNERSIPIVHVSQCLCLVFAVCFLFVYQWRWSYEQSLNYWYVSHLIMFFWFSVRCSSALHTYCVLCIFLYILFLTNMCSLGHSFEYIILFVLYVLTC